MIGYVYKITNLINQKSYIGKTIYSIEKRWKEHCRDYKKLECRERPLYRAMNKYGLENFSIKLIEEVDIKNLSEREIYWIEYYHTFSNGYNATLGGDGKVLYDYELIAELIKQQKTTKEICEQIGCCPDVVRLVASKNNLKINGLNLLLENKKAVHQFDKEGNYIQSFESYADAARWLESNGYVSGNLSGVRGHIGDVCKGKRKTAYKFKWTNNIKLDK